MLFRSMVMEQVSGDTLSVSALQPLHSKGKREDACVRVVSIHGTEWCIPPGSLSLSPKKERETLRTLPWNTDVRMWPTRSKGIPEHPSMLFTHGTFLLVSAAFPGIHQSPDVRSLNKEEALG